MDLFDDLAIKTANKHTNYLSYTPEVWEASKITDQDSNNTDNVMLFYGYSDTDNNYITDTTRDKDLNGGNAGIEWNREHVFPNSLANPSLGAVTKSGPPYADAHNLRPSDITMNGKRGNRKYADGSGNATNATGNWYPGDTWKGDAARIILYMYLRYGSQCLPSFVTVGTTNTIDSNMVNLLLEWNAEDSVSVIEDNRNSYHGNISNTYAQGNRNPFIDNPYLATIIWGGTKAENRWESTSADTATKTSAVSKAAKSIVLKSSTCVINEDFESIIEGQSSYKTRTWTGTNGLWTATDARTDQILNGNAITIRDGALTSPSISEGIKSLTVTTQLIFSGSAGIFDVLVNGSSVGSIPYNATSTITTIPNINIKGNIVLVLKNQSTSNRVRIDDLSWECYSVLNDKDFILNKFKIYPNSIKDDILNIETMINTDCTIYNLLGEEILIRQVDKNNSEINVSILKKGVYILQLKSENKDIIMKLIKE